MARVLVVGDLIQDQYEFCKADRICPEAPALVVTLVKQRTCRGGAGLVSDNLKSLLGVDSVDEEFGSFSIKRRTFADRHLIVRLDRDRYTVKASDKSWDAILSKAPTADAIVVSDYGKGAITEGIAKGLMSLHKPLFVDAKRTNPSWYAGCFAIFPNQDEHNGLDSSQFQHIIRKLGPDGCAVDGVHVPVDAESHVYDLTGAGDVFLAAFVAQWVQYSQAEREESAKWMLEFCARKANRAASISVRELGTYIVRPSDMQGELP